MYSKTYFLIIFLTASNLEAVFSSKELEGYPNGYLSDCPGSTKPAFIAPKSLKHLSITVIGTNSKKYNYFQMKKLIMDPNFDKRKRTFLYVGGFMDSPGFLIARIFTRMYKDRYNVMLLDTNYFTTMEYPVASRFTRPVGKHVAEMLTELTKLGLDPSRLELLGVSLGAQTMGFIGKNYQLRNHRNISRMTGLDPAGPCFRNLDSKDRLDKTDADFVDVVLTNIDGFGMAAPIGHVNFYVNGGEYQPGDFLWIPCNVLCSHLRSITLWYSAFYNPTKFIGIKCKSVQQARFRDCYGNTPLITNTLGLNCNRNETGIFYLPTNSDYPYYLGEMGLRKESEFFSSKLISLNKNDTMQI